MYNLNIYDIIKGCILLLFTLISNFNANTLSCQTEKLFRNVVVQHLTNLIIIYLFIDLNNKITDDPLKSITKSILVWICYIMVSRMDIYIILLVVGLFISSYIIQKYIDYYKSNNEKYKKNEKNKVINKLNNAKQIIVYIIIITTILGFSNYLYKNIKEHKSKFNLLTFIFGKTKCDKLL